ncbi:cytochrome c oxidase assembly protein [Curtobacterium sp. MCPF17_050]|uniref:cytochrome c oxidase assembly protein n=1 Tax=Curtobacterium sp. MCPF17_050 TaxID=2175664 RepID=UPI0032E7FF42
MATTLVVVAAAVYGRWVLAARRRGARWPWWRTVAFVAALGLFATLQSGIVGQDDRQLRWAFVLRLATLFFAVPAFAAAAGPLALLRTGGPTRLSGAAAAVLRSRPARLLGNAIVAPLVALAVFGVLLTPLAGVLRQSFLSTEAVTVLVPVLGFLLLAPLSEVGVLHSSAFATAEFLLAFVELVLDAVPAVVMRVSGHVLDGAGRTTLHVPWTPSPLQDQHLAGDLLWFIAEVADVPVLIALFVRWQRSDRREARAVDDLTDEQMAALTREHLRRRS